jgi:hypothetical protein
MSQDRSTTVSSMTSNFNVSNHAETARSPGRNGVAKKALPDLVPVPDVELGFLFRHLVPRGFRRQAKKDECNDSCGYGLCIISKVSSLIRNCTSEDDACWPIVITDSASISGPHTDTPTDEEPAAKHQSFNSWTRASASGRRPSTTSKSLSPQAGTSSPPLTHDDLSEEVTLSRSRSSPNSGSSCGKNQYEEQLQQS